jgi:ABC-type multidrug transport system ATPase subunit
MSLEKEYTKPKRSSDHNYQGVDGDSTGQNPSAVNGHTKAVNNVSLNINKNECYIVVGPNGAGKSSI